eukprot:scaffold1372_cov351-Pavlova_lutheri.AAC.5
MLRTVLATIVAGAAVLPCPVFADGACKTVLEVLSENEELSTLLEVVESTGLADALNDKEAEYTLFAPVNEAFDQLLVAMEQTLEELLEDTEMVRNGTLYHVVNGTIKSTDVAAYPDGIVVNTLLEGGTLVLNLDSLTVVPTFPYPANMIDTDVEACGSIVHTIDTVMLPIVLEG